METLSPEIKAVRAKPSVPLRLIGILGGVASGKSLVSAIFAEHGLGVLDADRAGHEALRLKHVVDAVRKRWGDDILGPDKQINRRRVAEIVFRPGKEGASERAFLEQITHPEIALLLMQEAHQLSTMGVTAAILDAAVMVEAGWDNWCDKLVYIEVPRTIRLARALARGWTEEDFIAREGVQESLDFKCLLADVVIDNSGSPDETRLQIERCLPSLLQ